MSQLADQSDILDPYQILEIPHTASEEQIKQAFQKKLVETNGSEKIIAAYGKIRDSGGRRQFRWGSIQSYLKDPQQDIPSFQPKDVDVQSIIKELAFRTEWELGDETCLK